MEWISLRISVGTPVLALCEVTGFTAQCQGREGAAQGQVWHLQARAGTCVSTDMGDGMVYT